MQNAFVIFRKEGILEFNKDQLELASPMYQRERKTTNDDDQLTMCGLCKGFYARKAFKRHKYKCQGDSCYEACSVHLSLLASESQVNTRCPEFCKEILCRFKGTDIGDLM